MEMSPAAKMCTPGAGRCTLNLVKSGVSLLTFINKNIQKVYKIIFLKSRGSLGEFT